MSIIDQPGLKLSLVGAFVFVAGILSLLLLPAAIAVGAMLIGGMAAWSGFVWTLFDWYRPTPRPPSTPGS